MRSSTYKKVPALIAVTGSFSITCKELSKILDISIFFGFREKLNRWKKSVNAKYHSILCKLIKQKHTFALKP